MMKEYTTLSEELAKLSPERQERIRARKSKIYIEDLTLKYLQRKLELSEEELDQYFNEMQPTSSSLESEDINNLRQDIANELGGTLKITIKIPHNESRIEARVCKVDLQELTFKYLQKNLGFSQEELGKYLREMQALNSNIEGQKSLDINTLREVVKALGGTFEITIEAIEINNKTRILSPSLVSSQEC